MVFERLRMSLQLDTSGFKSNIQDAKSELGTLGDSAADIGSRMQSVGKSMTAGVTAPLVGAGAASAKFAADFDQAMTESVSVMGDISDSMREDLEETAREVATEMTVSHEEAASSYYYLASAGLDAADSMEAMPEVAALSQAANMDMAQATDVATNVMSAFGKEADELTEVTDRMTAVTQNHNQTMEGMADALSRVAPTAAGVGVELGELNAALGQLGDQGIQGQRAGTALNTAISKMSDESSSARQKLEEMGVQVENSQGEMRPLADIFRQLEEAGADASDMAAIFGTQAGPAMAALLQEGGDALEEHANAIDNADGATQEMAKTQQNTLNAQLEIFRSNIRDAGIAIGENLLPVLNSLVDRLQPIAESFQNLTDRQQRLIIGFGAAAAALGPLLVAFGTFLTMLPAMQAGWAALAAVQWGTAIPAAAATVAAYAPIIATVGAVAAAVAALWYAWENNLGNIQGHTETVISAVTTAFKTLRSGVETAFSGLQSLIQPFFEWLGGIYNQYLAPLGDQFQQTFAVWRSAISGFVEWARPYIGTFVDGFVGVIERLWNIVSPLFENGFNNLVEVARFAFDTLRTVLEGWIDIFTSTFRALLAVLRGDWEEAWNIMTNLVGRQVDRIISIVTDFGGTLQTIFSNAVDAVIEVFQNLYDTLIGNSIIPDMLDDIIEAVSDLDLADAFENPLEEALETVKGFASDMKEAGSDLVSSLADGIESGTDIIGGAANSAADAVSSRMPSSPADEGPLSDLDEYGPGFVDTFADGIESSTGRVAGATNTLAGNAQPQSNGGGGSGDLRSALEGMALDLSGTLDVTGDVATMDDVDARLRKKARESEI